MDESLHIQEIICEAEQFRSAFARFRGKANAIDGSLCSLLHEIVVHVDKFLESNPTIIEQPHKNQLYTNKNLRKFGIHKTYFCDTCKSKISGNNIEAWNHIKKCCHGNKKNGMEERLSKKSLKNKLSKSNLPKKAIALCQCDLQNFFTENLAVAKKLIHLPEYDDIENELLTLIRPAFPDQAVKIYLFGSRLAGIGTIHSDLDIFIDIGGIFNNFENRPSEETKKKLKIVKGLLNKNPQWSQLIAIEKARVPILKLLYNPKFINCDIGFSNSLGFCNTRLTRYFMEIQPITRALAFFIKKWFERTKLDEHISTYSATLLVVCYLQINNLLPSVKILQEDLEEKAKIGPWLAVFVEKSLQNLNITQVPYMLKNFITELRKIFKFYAEFDFKKLMLCPYLGCAISIQNLESSPLLPRYVEYIQSEKENKDALLKIAHINLQDPFQLNHNVTKAVPQTIVPLLKQYFELSAEALEIAETPPAKK